MTKPTLYIAGPMTGIPEYNRPAFFNTARDLRAAGYPVLNPARREPDPDWTWQDYMRAAIRDIANSDGVATLRNWGHSPGAKVEVALAVGIRLPVFPASWWLEHAPEQDVNTLERLEARP